MPIVRLSFGAAVAERVPGAKRPGAPTGSGALESRSHFSEWADGLRELVALPKRGRKKREKKN
jgi:hypothetical protein